MECEEGGGLEDETRSRPVEISKEVWWPGLWAARAVREGLEPGGPRTGPWLR